MVPILIEGPAVEPLGLAQMRASLRLDQTVEDALLGDLIRAARVHVEDLSGRKLIAQTWRLVLDAWPRGDAIISPLSPLIALDVVEIADADGLFSDLPLSDFRLLAGDPPSILVDTGAPLPGRARDGIRVTLVAGYGEAPADVPAPLVEAIRRTVARWFEHRGDDAEGGLPADIAALIAPYRRPRI